VSTCTKLHRPSPSCASAHAEPHTSLQTATFPYKLRWHDKGQFATMSRMPELRQHLSTLIRRCAVVWVLLLISIPAISPAASVAEPCLGRAEGCVPVGHWNFSITMGAGLRSNPLAMSRPIPLVLLPELSYYGRRVFLHDLDFGITVADTAHQSLNVVATPSYDRVYFYRSDLQNFLVSGVSAAYGAAPMPVCPCTLVPLGAGGGQLNAVQMPARRPGVVYLAGPEWTFTQGTVTGQLDVLRDMTSGRGGTEVRAALARPFRVHGATLTAHLGFTWKSRALVDYYYGVPRLYAPGAAISPFVKFSLDRPLAAHWRLRALVDAQRLGDGIAASPIVTERFVATGVLGVVHDF
jgi:outer membrane protein